MEVFIRVNQESHKAKFLLNRRHHWGFLDLILNVHITSPIASPEVSGKAFGNKQSVSQWCPVKIQSQI